jgi:hypothetical protein
MLLVLSPTVLVTVLASDFALSESDKRNVFKAADNPMIKPKIDNDHEHDWRQNDDIGTMPGPNEGRFERQRPEPANLLRDERVVLVRRCARCRVE